MANYLGASVFVAFDGDHIGREVGRASLANDIEGLRKLSQGIEAGNNIWGSWALACGGTVISLGGDEGRLEVPADKLADLPSLQAQYQGAVGAPCSVGVGLELSEADKALLYAKVHGGNRVCFFTPDVDEEVQELADRQERRSEVDKLADEYLGKSLMTYEDIEAFRKGDVLHPRFPQRPAGGPAPRGPAAKVVPLAPAQAQAQQARKQRLQSTFESAFETMAQDPGLQQAARERATADKERQLRMGGPKFKVGDRVRCSHSHDDAPGSCNYPWEGRVTGYEPNISRDNDEHHYTVAWKTRPGSTSEGLHPQSQLEHLQLGKAEAPGQAQPPHANQSASGSQGQQARQALQGQQAQQMDAPQAPPPAGETDLEQRLHAHAQKQKGQDTATLAVQQQQNSKEALKQQVVKVLKQMKAAAPLLEEAKSQAPQVYKAVVAAMQAMVAMAKQLTGNDSPVQDNSEGEGDGGGEDLGKAEADRHKCVKCGSRNIDFAEPRTGARLRPSPNSKLGGIGHCTDCGSNQIRRLKYHGPRKGHDAQVIPPKETEKAELPMPDAGATHHELNLPVGSTRDGRVKVRHGDGTASWVEVRSGMVMSQDGHPISARNPGGK